MLPNRYHISVCTAARKVITNAIRHQSLHLRRNVRQQQLSQQQIPNRLLNGEASSELFTGNEVALNDDDTISNEIMDELVVENGDSLLRNSTDDESDMNELVDELLDEIFEEIFDPMNTKNTTDDEFYDEILDAIFDDNTNTTTTNTTLDLIDEMLTDVFGTSDDDTPNNEKVLPEINKADISPLINQNKDTTSNYTKTLNSPTTPNVTTIPTENEQHDNDDEPESPLISTPSPTLPKPYSIPTTTSTPTESPSMEHIDNFDKKDKETEVTDDLFDNQSYKNRPGGGNVPKNKTSLTAILGTIAAIIGMIFTAWQMSDNPDGIYASLCRLTLTCIQLLFRIIMSPCRKFIPCCYSHHHHHHMAGTNGYHEPYGHLPVSTMDYGYKDPSLELT
jgi:hypothetical protein